MNRRLRRGCVAAAGVAALATTALTATAQAAPAVVGPWQTSSVLQGTVSWTRLGTVGGRPGNAHSGEVLLVSDEPYVGSEMLDWQCPRGVTPPTDLDTSGRCTLLASTQADPVNVDDSIRYCGQLSVSLLGTWEVGYSRWTNGQQGPSTVSRRTVDADIVPVGSQRRSVSDQVDGGYETETTTYTAPMQLRGAIPGVTLPATGYTQSSKWARTVTRVRQVS